MASDLAARLGVSDDTVRRDLDDLAAAGAIRRVRGGALPPAPPGGRYADRRDVDVAAKDRLALAAASLLPRTGVVAVGGGTTLLALARHWPEDFAGTVVTVSPDAALALPPTVEVVLPGGRLHPDARTLVGADTVEAVRAIHADVCVLGACSLHPEAGLGADHRDEAQVMAAMLAGAARVVVVAAGAKLGTAAPFVVAPPEAVHVLITDAGEATTAPWRARGVEVRRP